MAGPASFNQASQGLAVVSHNVNGIRDTRKRAALFHRLAAFGSQLVVLLQETHCAPEDDVGRWLSTALGEGRPWGGHAYWAHGRRGCRGVAVLLGSGIANDDIRVEYSDTDAGAQDSGRVLRVGWSDQHTRTEWAAVNVYAPNDGAARRDFFGPEGPVAAALAAGRQGAKVLLGGDFNCVIDPDDSGARAAVADASSASASALMALLSTTGLDDAWLFHHARTPEQHGLGARFTHYPAAGGAARRLDRIYLSSDLADARVVVACTHLPLGDLPGDHCGVTLTLQSPAAQGRTAPPRWRLPLELLHDPAFVADVLEEAACMSRLSGRNWGAMAGQGRMARWQLFKLRVCVCVTIGNRSEAKPRKQRKRKQER